MNGSLWIVSCAISVGIGVVVGYYLGRREIKRNQAVEDRKDPAGAPHLHPKTKSTIVQRVFAGVIAIIAVVMVVQASTAADRDRQQSEDAQNLALAQSKCNSQLYDAIDVRAAGNREDASLQQADNAALLELVTGLLALPPGNLDQANTVQEQLMKYRDKINQSDTRRAQIAQERQANPYPVPSCGLDAN